MRSLDGLLKNRSLVSIHRSGIDGHVIHGQLVGISDFLVALDYVYDFQFDGLMFLRRSEVSGITRTATDKFQEALMAREGVRAASRASGPFYLDSWPALLEQLADRYPFMIVERELGPAPRFSIGRPTKITQAQVEIQTFSGIGDFSAKPRRLKYPQITSVQVGTRYIDFYQRHFERKTD